MVRDGMVQFVQRHSTSNKEKATCHHNVRSKTNSDVPVDGSQCYGVVTSKHLNPCIQTFPEKPLSFIMSSLQLQKTGQIGNGSQGFPVVPS